MKKEIELSRNKILPSLRVESKLDELMKEALGVLNQNPALKIDLSTFRRMAYHSFSQSVLKQGLEIKFSPELKTK